MATLRSPVTWKRGRNNEVPLLSVGLAVGKIELCYSEKRHKKVEQFTDEKRRSAFAASARDPGAMSRFDE